MAGDLKSSLTTFLRDYILPDIRLGKQIGKGAYGRVLEGEWGGRKVAVKQIHPIFAGETDNLQFRMTKEYFEKECNRCLRMSHPNIVMFHGVHFPPGAVMPSLVMERLHCSLTDYLDQQPRILIRNKLSMMTDVTYGLKYLHYSQPPIIHRDLSSNNVLISKGSRLIAKIGDLGASRFVDPGRRSKMSQMPGTVVFMPPEACHEYSGYGVELDVFSFGCVMLHTFSHIWPNPTQAVFADPVTGELKARSESERRSHYFECIMHGIDKSMSSTLITLINSCLNNLPKERPSIAKVNRQLEDLAENETHPSPTQDNVANLLSPVTAGQSQAKPRSLSANAGEAAICTTAFDYKIKSKPNSMPGFMTVQSEPALISRDKLHLWYHGMVTRKQAEQRLNSEPNGSFLIRISETHFGYSLSYKTTGCCKHFLIKQNAGKYFFDGTARQHYTLEDFVAYYQKNSINADGDRLKFPCAVEKQSFCTIQGYTKEVINPKGHNKLLKSFSTLDHDYVPPPLPPRSKKHNPA